MRGDRCLPGVAPHPGEDCGMRIYIDIPRLNRAASQERLWPSRVGRCEGLPNAATTHQRHLRSILLAQEARHHAVLAEMEMVLEEPPRPPEPPEAQGSGGS